MNASQNTLALILVALVLGTGCRSYDVEEGLPPKGYRNEKALKLAYATRMLKLIDAKPEVPAGITVHRDLLYKETPEKDLKLDIYYPEGAGKKRPLLVFIHGGSWKSGDKDDYRRYLVDYAVKGYATATLAYRFSQEAPFPAAFHDVVCGLKWLKANARNYPIDTSRIAVIGGSAGGHLALMLGYHANDSGYRGECLAEAGADIRAVVNLYGPVDLTTDFAINHPSVIQFVGTEYSRESRPAYLAVSPLTHLSADDPPTLTFHGTIDEVVPVSQADTLHQALQKAGVVSDYHRLEGWPHTMDLGLYVNQYCQYHMDAFFAKHLK